MKKIKSKLFQELKLENSSILKVIGGKAITTTVGSDTNSSGGGYDISFATYNSSGTFTGTDSYLTSPEGDFDKPAV